MISATPKRGIKAFGVVLVCLLVFAEFQDK
jgi:hypothetical protein